MVNIFFFLICETICHIVHMSHDISCTHSHILFYNCASLFADICHGPIVFFSPRRAVCTRHRSHCTVNMQPNDGHTQNKRKKETENLNYSDELISIQMCYLAQLPQMLGYSVERMPFWRPSKFECVQCVCVCDTSFQLKS